MKEEYDPSSKEVLKEIFNEGKENLTRIRSLRTAHLKYFGKGFVVFSLVPYLVPTMLRKYSDLNKIREERSEIKRSGRDHALLAGTTIGGLGLFGQAYYSYHEFGVWSSLGILTLTNVTSGIYEFGRRKYNNTKQKLVEKHEKSSLEKRLRIVK